GFSIDVEIDFASEVIGRQRFAFDVNAESFTKEVSRARTFGFMADVEKLWSAGFALGASLENTVVIGEDRVVNPEGLRYDDEFVRHKALDAVGDLSLAGAPLIGAFKSYRGGHSLNIALLRAIFEDRDAWSLVELEPRRSHVAYSEASPRIATAAFGPDVS
ncbi:MAG: UDP-3-O-acyl-N-acetylglucosamine deacetylase, partial [Pseudomonadota bacterium]